MPYFTIQTINPDTLARSYQVIFREKTAPDESELVAGPFRTEAEALNNLALSTGLNHWQLAKALHFCGFETAPKTIKAWAVKGTTPPTTRSGRAIPSYRYEPEDRLWKPAPVRVA